MHKGYLAIGLGLFAALAGCPWNAESARAEDKPVAPEWRDFDADRLLADAKRQRDRLLKDASRDLTRDKVQLRQLKAKKDSKDAATELARIIGQVEKEIASARQGKLLLVPYLWPVGWASDPQDLFRGRVGRLTTKITVLQVAGENSFLGEPFGATDHSFGIVWFEGVSTTNLSDDSVADLCGRDELFLCIGTKTYETALGATKTVPAFRALTTSEVAEVRRRLARPSGKN